MKYLIYIFLFLCFSVKAQNNLTVDCGLSNTIYTNEVIVVDKLIFISNILLIQDNAVLYIKKVEGNGFIYRGGIGGCPTNEEGIDRCDGDASPTVVLTGGCKHDFIGLSFGTNIDVIRDFGKCSHINTGVNNLIQR